MSMARVLVVDDEEAVRHFLEEALTRVGYGVVTVESGEAALACLTGQTFDLVLLDLWLDHNGIDGIEVLKILHQQWPETAVIILTGHASVETAIEALRQGAYDYLCKPCDPFLLRDRIDRGLYKRQQRLQSWREDQQRFLRWSILEVDCFQYKITLAKKPLPLSPTEFKVLAYLVSQAPRPISPKELATKVLDYPGEVQTIKDDVRQHICRIRQAIHAVCGRPDVIVTIRGVGYTLNEHLEAGGL